MNCLQVDEYIFSYCDSELAPSLSSALESHIANCSDCQAKVELTRMENDVLRSGMIVPALSDGFTAGVMAAICKNGMNASMETAAVRSKRPWYVRTPLWLAATAAAFVLLIYTVSPGIFSPNKNIAEDKSTAVKVAEKNPAANFTVGGIVSQKMEQKNKEKAVLDENLLEEQSKSATLPEDSATDKSGNQVRTMISGGSGDSNSELFMKRDSCPDRDRTDAIKLKLPAGVNFEDSAAPMISNMPSAYHIVNTSNQNDTWTYFYQGDGKQITVALDSKSEPGARTLAAPAATEAPAAATCIGPECGDAGNLKADSLNSVSRSVEVNDVCYQLTVTGELSLDELNTLASKLTVEK